MTRMLLACAGVVLPALVGCSNQTPDTRPDVSGAAGAAEARGESREALEKELTRCTHDGECPLGAHCKAGRACGFDCREGSDCRPDEACSPRGACTTKGGAR